MEIRILEEEATEARIFGGWKPQNHGFEEEEATETRIF